MIPGEEKCRPSDKDEIMIGVPTMTNAIIGLCKSFISFDVSQRGRAGWHNVFIIGGRAKKLI